AWGVGRGRTLLVEDLPFCSVHKTLQNDRPVSYSNKSAGCDRQIVANKIKLGYGHLLREVEFLRMRYPHFVVAYRKYLGFVWFTLWHGDLVPPSPLHPVYDMRCLFHLRGQGDITQFHKRRCEDVQEPWSSLSIYVEIARCRETGYGSHFRFTSLP